MLNNRRVRAASNLSLLQLAARRLGHLKEACLYEGKISGDDWVPYFSSKIMGDVLTAVAEKNSEIEFLVLCGHTHHAANLRYGNLNIEVGNAEYCRPEIQKIILV